MLSLFNRVCWLFKLIDIKNIQKKRRKTKIMNFYKLLDRFKEGCIITNVDDKESLKSTKKESTRV